MPAGRSCAALVVLLLAFSATGSENGTPGGESDAHPWNAVMANLVAHTDAYWISRPILVYLDVWDDAEDLSTPAEVDQRTIRVSWLRACAAREDGHEV